MKNQYFGDINDYRKYGLLRLLAEGGRKKIMICWMLTCNDSRSDGRRISYVDDPQTWRPFDPELFDFLKFSLDSGIRDVGVVGKEGLIPGASFHADILGGVPREDYFRRLHERSKGVDLIFFDPDNGMEVPTVSKGNANASKYLFWDEAGDFYSTGCSLLVYQHFPRVNRRDYARKISGEFFTKVGATEIFSFQTSTVVYFLLPQPGTGKSFERSVGEVGQKWKDEFIITRRPS